MSKDDRRNKWTSDGNASLGFSFWSVIWFNFISINNILNVTFYGKFMIQNVNKYIK